VKVHRSHSRTLFNRQKTLGSGFVPSVASWKASNKKSSRHWHVKRLCRKSCTL